MAHRSNAVEALKVFDFVAKRFAAHHFVKSIHVIWPNCIGECRTVEYDLNANIFRYKYDDEHKQTYGIKLGSN